MPLHTPSQEMKQPIYDGTLKSISTMQIFSLKLKYLKALSLQVLILL